MRDGGREGRARPSPRRTTALSCRNRRASTPGRAASVPAMAPFGISAKPVESASASVASGASTETARCSRGLRPLRGSSRCVKRPAGSKTNPASPEVASARSASSTSPHDRPCVSGSSRAARQGRPVGCSPSDRASPRSTSVRATPPARSSATTRSVPFSARGGQRGAAGRRRRRCRLRRRLGARRPSAQGPVARHLREGHDPSAVARGEPLGRGAVGEGQRLLRAHSAAAIAAENEEGAPRLHPTGRAGIVPAFRPRMSET